MAVEETHKRFEDMSAEEIAQIARQVFDEMEHTGTRDLSDCYIEPTGDGNAIILDGKRAANNICIGLKKRVEDLKAFNIFPRLTIVTSGNDAASEVYVKNKLKKAEEIGIDAQIVHHYFLSKEDAEEACDCNCPIIFQLPINGDVLIEDLNMCNNGQMYDVDGFVSNYNISMLATGWKPEFYPCTPKGIMALLYKYEIDVSGMSVCIIGRSNIVGRPLARMMEQAGATVTLCHSKTPEELLYRCINNADIVVSATGVRNVITFEKMLQYEVHLTYTNWPDNGTSFWDKVFVDVGINRDENGKLCGDIDPRILKYSKAYTPVPGGIGPMTVAMLMENVVEYYEKD